MARIVSNGPVRPIQTVVSTSFQVSSERHEMKQSNHARRETR